MKFARPLLYFFNHDDEISLKIVKNALVVFNNRNFFQIKTLQNVVI
jgi:hypothetical protein